MKDFVIDEVLRHIPKTISPEIMDYARDVAFLSSRYIFTRREVKKQFGYCTHCKNDFPTAGLRHNGSATCPMCKSHCEVRASGVGRKYMKDEVYFVYYEKSVKDPGAIIARGFYAIRDYSGDFRKTQTLIEAENVYLFQPGGGKMITRFAYYSSDKTIHTGSWQTRKSVCAEPVTSSNKRYFYSADSIVESVNGTQFQYSTWEQYKCGDMVHFFDLFARYPCIEYLTKLGFREVVEDKLYSRHTYGAVNWVAKNPLKVLRMDKQDMKRIQSLGIKVDSLFLKLIQISKKDGSNLTVEEIKDISFNYSDYAFKDLRRALKRMSLRKITSYIDKQIAKKKQAVTGYRKRELLSTWNDYINDCIKLGLDLNREAVLLPSDLHRAHQNTINQVKIKEDQELKAKFAARSAVLEKMAFSAMGLMLRPPKDQIELIEEGKALHHCVGTYAVRYTKGETDLFVIRKVDELDKPFYTLEVRGGQVAQCRGSHNCDMTPQVKAFVEAFKAEKLEKKQMRIKTQNQVVVAV